MNQMPYQELQALERKAKVPDIVSPAPYTCRFRAPFRQAPALFGLLTVGFLRHGRTKRMSERMKSGPVCLRTGPGRSFFPPSPGYPLLGCTPAEPNSVSPGKIHHTSRFRYPRTINECVYQIGHPKHEKTVSQVAQNPTAKNSRIGPKSTEPDHRLQRPNVGTERTIMQEMTALVLTLPAESIY
jgi:hypothetical protein